MRRLYFCIILLQESFSMIQFDKLSFIKGFKIFLSDCCFDTMLQCINVEMFLCCGASLLRYSFTILFFAVKSHYVLIPLLENVVDTNCHCSGVLLLEYFFILIYQCCHVSLLIFCHVSLLILPDSSYETQS